MSMSYKELLQQRQALEAQIAAARQNEVSGAVKCRIPDDCIDSKRYLSHPGRLHRL